MTNDFRQYVLVVTEEDYREHREWIEEMCIKEARLALSDLGYRVKGEQIVEWVKKPMFLALYEGTEQWACRVTSLVEDRLELIASD